MWKENKIVIRAPLFDRLTDLNPETRDEGRPRSTLTHEQLTRSVAQELELLLNTRSPLPLADLTGREPSVIDYGVPDLGGYLSTEDENQVQLRGAFVRAIQAYEPRLSRVKVELEPRADRPRALRVKINAHLTLARVSEPVSFIVNVEQSCSP